MSKVAIIGAGNVGGLAGTWIAGLGLADVVLIDKGSGRAKGKAMDINDALAILGSDRWVDGGDDYSLIEDSDIVVITAGVPRRPGMTREDLRTENEKIIGDILDKAVKFVKESTAWIIVTNPLDYITNFVYQRLSIDRHKVMGMGVNLDSSRMVNQVSKILGVSRSSVKAMVVGQHGRGMLPLVDDISVNGVKVALSEKEKDIIRDRTINRGAEIVAAFGDGSAYVAPGAGIYQIVRSILTNSKEVLPLSVRLEGEYGINGKCLGVPVKLGHLAWDEVIKIPWTEEVLSKLRAL